MTAQTKFPGMPDLAVPKVGVPDPATLAENFPKIAERSQRLVQDYLQRQSTGDFYSVPDPGVVGKAFLEMTRRLMADPGKLIEAQMRFWQEYMTLWQNSSLRAIGAPIHGVTAPPSVDKRFSDDEWAENAVFDFIKQSYLLSARTIHNMVKDVKGLDESTARKVDFYTRQFVDAMSPTNFVLTNPKVLRATLESGGENLVRGLKNLLEDLDRGKGQLRIRMTNLDTFKLGENVAATPGKVVHQTDLMQLLQYEPTTNTAFKRPLLIVPPWINKFYILDLRPKNSFIKWAVDQGFTVFVISWVNPDERLREKQFDDYLSEGTLAALDAITLATGEREVNAIGYCIGGTLLACTEAYLAAKQDERITSGTFFTTMLDFSDVGELSVFIDDEQIALMEEHMKQTGFLEGQHMSSAFNLLRANDLIWSFVVKNYLLGEEPFPFDLLYWNSDSTRMPRNMHSFYLRNMYLNNRLREPGAVSLAGEAIDLGKISAPAYFVSTIDDHIAPWKSTYHGSNLLGGPVQFVLGGSGHIAGVINPAGSRKYGYRTNDRRPADADAWLSGASEQGGSWWPHWFEWAKGHAGPEVRARVPGDGDLVPIENAPGSFVKVRIEE